MGQEAFLAAQILDFAEATDDRVASLLQAGTGIALTYNDGAGTLTIASTVSPTWGSIGGTLSSQTDLQAALDARQPLDSDLTAIAALTTTTFGRALLTQADAAATRSTIGAGTGTIGGSTGSTANAIARASGTGGTTLQASAFVIPDIATASPNNTVNHASIQAIGATTNVSASIVPKGSGAFSLAVPDGASTGGNARGANAIDLQTSRSIASQVASSAFSVVIGNFCTASGPVRGAYAIGYACTASGIAATAIGDNATASGQQSLAIGSYPTASGIYATAMQYANASGQYSFAHGYDAYASQQCSTAFGFQVSANRQSMSVFGNGRFSSFGDAQQAGFVLRIRTTNATPTTMMLDGSSARLTINDGEILSFVANIVGSKSTGTAISSYMRRGVIKRIGASTSLVGSIQTIGTDIEDNAATDVAITADDTNEALQIQVTGIAGETWRWVAIVEAADLGFGA